MKVADAARCKEKASGRVCEIADAVAIFSKCEVWKNFDLPESENETGEKVTLPD